MSAPNPSEPRTFAAVGDDRAVKAAYMQMGCILLILAPLLWFIVGLLLVAVLSGLATPLLWLISAVITGGLLTLMVRLKLAQTRKGWAASSITIDDRGITQRDPHATRFLGWSDVRTAGPVVSLKGYQTKGGSLAADAAGSVGSHLTASVGLIGRGTLQVDADAGHITKKTYEQNLGRWGVEDGVPLIGITPNLVGDNWDRTELGAIIGHYRPDILAQAIEVMDKRDPKRFEREARQQEREQGRRDGREGTPSP